MEMNSKADAQARADQIRFFQAELALIEQEKVVALSKEQQGALKQYHDELLARLAAVFDIDATRQEKQCSLGMKIASFLGALGLGASVC